MPFHFQKQASINRKTINVDHDGEITASQAVASETRSVPAISRALHLLRRIMDFLIGGSNLQRGVRFVNFT